MLSVREINRMKYVKKDSEQLKMAIENLKNVVELKLMVNAGRKSITLISMPEKDCYVVPTSVLIDYCYKSKKALLSSASTVELYFPISQYDTAKNLDLFKKLLQIITHSNAIRHLSLKENNLSCLTIPDIQSIMQLIPEDIQFLDLAYNDIMSSSAGNKYVYDFLHTLPDNLRLCHLFDSQFFNKNKIESQLEELKKYDSKYLDLAIEIARRLIGYKNKNGLIIDTIYQAANDIIVCQSLDELDVLKSIYTVKKTNLSKNNIKLFLQINDTNLNNNTRNELLVLFDLAKNFFNRKIKSPAKSARSVI